MKQGDFIRQLLFLSVWPILLAASASRIPLMQMLFTVEDREHQL
jgi:hypothetical protein